MLSVQRLFLEYKKHPGQRLHVKGGTHPQNIDTDGLFLALDKGGWNFNQP